MNAITIEQPGESGTLREIPDEQPQRDEVRVRISVAGVNPVDWKMRDGMPGSPPPPMPLTLGQDFAGIVESAGAGSGDIAAGDRVFGIARAHGSFAEFTSVPVASHDSPIGKIPNRVSDEEAAALPTPGLTALASLDTLQVGHGTTLLINGAAGTVGSIATQLAHARGATVIATVKGDADDMRGLGADAVIDAATTDVVAEVKKTFAGGIDAVLDVASHDRESAMRLATVLRAGGAIVATTYMLDRDTLAADGFHAKNITMSQEPQSSRAGLELLAGLVADGKLHVRVGREFPLRDAARVLDDTKSGKLAGKTVLRVTGTGDAG
jgi:NADPH:quinone reductase-like Zn-dependent oxidoreductase